MYPKHPKYFNQYKFNMSELTELTDLQESLLEAIKKNSENILLEKKCFKKNKELRNLMSIKTSENYISRVLSALEQKKKIKFKTEYLPGHQGKRRTITIL